jgi:hypothetical protein
MAIYQYLDMSTAHVKEEDMERLELLEAQLHVKNYPEGAIIPIPSDDYMEEFLDKAKAGGLSESFCKAIRYSAQQNCYLLRLDGAGDLIDDPALDEHDWGASSAPR